MERKASNRDKRGEIIGMGWITKPEVSGGGLLKSTPKWTHAWEAGRGFF